MKKYFLTVLTIAFSISLCAQAPEGFSYHAVVSDNNGNPLVKESVSFRFSIIKGDVAGDMVYIEVHDVVTDEYGAVSLVIGKGNTVEGNFSLINWGNDSYFLKIEIDKSGGTAYTEMGTSQLLSVPYALYAKEAGNVFSGNYNDLINKPLTDGSETKVKADNINLNISGTGTADDPYVITERIHYVGENSGGGIVFYVYDKGRHGLIAAPSDQDQGIEWYNGIKRYTNTTGDGLGAGEMNTALIIAQQTSDNPMSNFAAKVCADYSVTSDGVSYGDWYLPSKYELALLYLEKDIVGNLKGEYYWSSTEFSSISAWAQNFSTGAQTNLNKSLPYSVRAVRAF